MSASNLNAAFQFSRQFGVPLDSSFVFSNTAARSDYLTNPNTSGIAYTGMIVADLQTNKVYILNSSRAWQEVGITVNETFGASNSGILFKTGNNTFSVGGLSSGNNISITNPSGLAGNPTIGLSSSITGLNSISGVNEFRIGSNSGIVLDAGDGAVTVDDLTVNGATNLNGNINISLAAQIIATQAIIYSGTPTIFAGNVLFDTLPKVGPTGNNGANATGVSLEGHDHVYTDITDFCDGVASCVDTALLASTGIQLNYSNDTLSIALSGQALRLHNLNTNGLIVRSGENILARTISPSGSNILIGNGDGVGSNPIIGLDPNPTVQSLTTSGTLTVGTNLTVDGNLTINGDTVITNVSVIEVEDPSIRIGATTGTLAVGDFKDRGIEFVYQTGNAVPITGFFGYDHNANAFVFLNNVNATGSYAGTSSILNVGGLHSTGGVSGTILTSTTAQGTVSPIVVSSSGLVTNLNSDYLDGQDGSYYRNAGSLTGTIPTEVLPVASTTQSGIARFDNSNFVFNTAGIASTKNTVYTSGTQRVSGVKSFSDRLNLESGVIVSGITSIVAASSSNATTYFPVFTGSDPATTSQALVRRTLDNIRSDLGSTSNSTGVLVLRDTINGGFTAGTITATGFVGYGGGITGIDASNIASGTLSSGLLPDIATPFSTGSNTPTSIFINGLTVDRAGRLLSATTGTFVNATDSIKGIAKFSIDNFAVDANGNVTIKNSGVILGTETSGQYAQSLTVSGTGLSATTAGVDDGTAYTITINATPSNVPSGIVARDINGNFSASAITVTGLITESVSGSLSAGIYKSSSISGINNSTYLHNFIIDGGTP
jgi:hypothetical protein